MPLLILLRGEFKGQTRFEKRTNYRTCHVDKTHAIHSCWQQRHDFVLKRDENMLTFKFLSDWFSAEQEVKKSKVRKCRPVKSTPTNVDEYCSLKQNITQMWMFEKHVQGMCCLICDLTDISERHLGSKKSTLIGRGVGWCVLKILFLIRIMYTSF